MFDDRYIYEEERSFVARIFRHKRAVFGAVCVLIIIDLLFCGFLETGYYILTGRDQSSVAGSSQTYSIPVISSSGPKICIVTAYLESEPEQKLKSIVFPQIVDYGRKHGYGVADAMEDDAIRSMYGDLVSRRADLRLFKFHILKHLLKDYDWLFWIENDSIFLCTDVSASIFTSNDSNIVAMRGISEYFPLETFDTGAVFFKNDTWTSSMLDSAIKMLGESCQAVSSGAPFWVCLPDGKFTSDSSVLEILYSKMGTGDRSKIKTFSPGLFGSQFPYYADRDYLLRFPARTTQEKIFLAGMVLKNLDTSTGRVCRTPETSILEPSSGHHSELTLPDVASLPNTTVSS